VANRLIVGQELWSTLKRHLLRDAREHLAFVLAGHAAIEGGHLLLARDLILIDDSELEGEGDHFAGLALRLDPLVSVMNEAKRKGLVLAEAHSHPFARERVRFSATDLNGQSEFYNYLCDVFGQVPYGALVLGGASVDGLIWTNPGKPDPIAEFRIIGDDWMRLATTSARRPARPLDRSRSRRHARQILALGDAGQRILETVHVAIVGLGGLGSLVAEQLAHLGVRRFTLVDDDRIETTNLNRLVGAKRSDVGRLKVDVAARNIRGIGPRSDVERIPGNVREPEALDALKRTDFIFGCVDSDSARLILNELTLAYQTPYIDGGVGIEAIDGGIVGAGGRVIVWVPGRPCLLCAAEIDVRVAGEELENEDQQHFRREHGYVFGADMPAPSVISLNATVASIAVTEFLALATGMRPSQHYTYYDMLEQRMGPRIVQANANCVACAVAAFGDRVNIQRYGLEDLSH